MGYRNGIKRQNGRNDNIMLDERPMPSRAPLVWQTDKSFQSGRIVLVLQSATLDNGSKRYSFRIGKASSGQPDKPFPFMDPRDVGCVREVLDAMDAHLQAAKSSDLVA